MMRLLIREEWKWERGCAPDFCFLGGGGDTHESRSYDRVEKLLFTDFSLHQGTTPSPPAKSAAGMCLFKVFSFIFNSRFFVYFLLLPCRRNSLTRKEEEANQSTFTLKIPKHQLFAPVL